MFFSILSRIELNGTLIIEDYKGKIRSFGISNPLVKIKFKSKSLERKLLINPSLYIGEAYMNKELLILEGSLENFLDIASSAYNEFISRNFYFKFFQKISFFLRPLHQMNHILNSKKNVAHHYDISDDFYKLFLDKDMQYSCGYFHNDNINLDQAQYDKKKHIINKLQINENMTVLDIGCGWGGLSLQIAKETGAKVTGITLSKNQLEFAKQRAHEQGLSEKVEFLLIDYREITRNFDRIVSVGMFEHVGFRYFTKFFKKVYNILNNDGVFLLHTIGQRGGPASTNAWIRKYIFPGGYIPSLSEIIKSTEKLDLNVTDIEILRLHYANTIKNWRANLLLNKKKVIEMFDEKFFRMWDFYLVGSEYSFRNMGNVVYQIQISKNINNLPQTRNYMYN